MDIYIYKIICVDWYVTYTYIYIYICVCVLYVYIYIYCLMFRCIHIYICIYIYNHIHIHTYRVPVVRIDSHRFENNFMNREAVRSGSVPLRFVWRPVHGFIRFHSVRFLSGIDCIITFYIL